MTGWNGSALVAAAAVLGAAGCGSSEPPPVWPSTLPPPGGSAAAPAASEPISSAPVSPVPPAPRVGLSPGVSRALQGISVMVNDLGGVLLFPDEQLAAKQVIADWAAQEGIAVVAPARTAEVYARAELGQDVATGKVCGTPLSSFEIPRRWKAALGAGGKIEPYVTCDPACVLQLQISIGLEGEGGSEFYAAPFDASKSWKDALNVALSQLTDNGGHERYGHANNPVQITGVAPPAGWPYASTDHEATLSAGELAATRACLAGSPSAHGGEVLLGYDARGAVARCEAHGVREPSCICKALARRTGAPSTREEASVSPVMPPAATSKDGLMIHAFASTTMVPSGRVFVPMTTDPAIGDWQVPERERLGVCFAGTPSGPEITATASVDFDRLGKPTKAVIVTKSGSLTPAQRQCLEAEFLRAGAPCPSAPSSSASADLTVKFEPPAKPKQN